MRNQVGPFRRVVEVRQGPRQNVEILECGHSAGIWYSFKRLEDVPKRRRCQACGEATQQAGGERG